MPRRLWTALRGALLLLPLLHVPEAPALSRDVPLDEVFTLGEDVFVGTVVSTRAVWGEGDLPDPADLMMVIQAEGGLVGGAFDGDFVAVPAQAV